MKDLSNDMTIRWTVIFNILQFSTDMLKLKFKLFPQRYSLPKKILLQYIISTLNTYNILCFKSSHIRSWEVSLKGKFTCPFLLPADNRLHKRLCSHGCTSQWPDHQHKERSQHPGRPLDLAHPLLHRTTYPHGRPCIAVPMEGNRKSDQRQG